MPSYTNPVVAGHAPDPSVVRVGNDYFLATSSFGMLPGIPIRHSTDLVNWRIIGHAVARPAQYRRDGRPGPVELFAPTLRHHDGRFYLACTNAHKGQGNFYVTAEDPAEWSDATWVDEEAFDPSLFRDEDGTWYYTRRSLDFGREDGSLGPIVQAEIDIATGSIGELRALTSGGGFLTNDIEGPHLFRRGDWYYLTAAEGSSWKGHLQSIGRSRSPWGPFEPAPHNPILSHRDRVGHPIQSVGHADLFDDSNGNWWAVSLGTRHAPLSHHHNIGRETFLTPVTWTHDGWPIIGRNGTTELQFTDAPLPVGNDRPLVAHEGLWLNGWTTLGPAGETASVREAAIRLPAGAEPWTTSAPTGALFRAQSADDQVFRATVTNCAEAKAGIGVYTDRRHNYFVVVENQGNTRKLRFRRQADDLITEETLPFPGDGPITLEVEARPVAYSFRASSSGHHLEIGTGSARLLSAEAAEWFVATHYALVSSGTSPHGFAEFTDITISDSQPLPPNLVPPFAADL
ncbi:family 43 glycosylhydrolase [Arthrobacter sp. NA-172]|uniref:glycoside hydrolase family 43 protein n=1 Tax=Arthrobacter sp. NA-172 TaxID=3367524 RepID=UPI0037549CC6